MIDRRAPVLWSMRGLYAALVLGLLIVQLLPLNTMPRGFAGPDLIVLLTFAWALRRPDLVPPLLVAVMLLIADLLLQRPPGLFAALVVIGSETLRARTMVLRSLPFMVEWVTASAVLALVLLVYRATLAVLLVDQAQAGLTMIQFGISVICYPIVVLASRYLFNVRKTAPGTMDVTGRTI